jgi:hypothetical protein
MATTFHVSLTITAVRRRHGIDLTALLLAPYSAAERKDVRILTQFLQSDGAPALAHPASNTGPRLMRIVIDIPKGRLSGPEEKQELLDITVRACVKYQAEKMDRTEVEVVINEMEVENVVRVLAKGR